MPLVRNNTIGAKLIASAKTARRFTVTANAGVTTTETNLRLPVTNLSQVFYYALMTAGPAGVTFTPEFAVDNFNSGAALAEPDWFPLLVPQVLVLNVPFFITERINANMASAIFTVPGGGAAATVEIIIAASQ
jgi:hypothetical protein